MMRLTCSPFKQSVVNATKHWFNVLSVYLRWFTFVYVHRFGGVFAFNTNTTNVFSYLLYNVHNAGFLYDERIDILPQTSHFCPQSIDIFFLPSKYFSYSTKICFDNSTKIKRSLKYSLIAFGMAKICWPNKWNRLNNFWRFMQINASEQVNTKD